LNYKTGQSTKSKVEKKTVIVVSGMKLGSCYKFRAFDYKYDYLSNVKGVAYNSPKPNLQIVFKVV